MITISYIIGEFIVNGVAILVAHALHTSDVVTIMTQSAGWLGLLSVILSAVKVNDTALYSSSLTVTNIVETLFCRELPYKKMTIILGALGTLLSVLGIMNKFVDFLIFLGVLFPPIAGVTLVDYYILRTHRKLLDFTRSHDTLPDASSTQKIG